MNNLICRKRRIVRKLVKGLSYEQIQDELIRLYFSEEMTSLTLYYYKLLQKAHDRHIKKIIKNPHIN